MGRGALGLSVMFWSSPDFATYVVPRYRFYTRFGPGFGPDTRYNSVSLHHTQKVIFGCVFNMFILLGHTSSHSIHIDEKGLAKARVAELTIKTGPCQKFLWFFL